MAQKIFQQQKRRKVESFFCRVVIDYCNVDCEMWDQLFQLHGIIQGNAFIMLVKI